MICYVYGKDEMPDYIKLLLVREHTYEGKELRNRIELAVHINTSTGGR